MPKLKAQILLEIEVLDNEFEQEAVEYYGRLRLLKSDLHQAVWNRLNWGDQHPGHPLFRSGNVKIKMCAFPGRTLYEDN